MLVNAGGSITDAVFLRGAASGVQSATVSNVVVSSGLSLIALSGGRLVNTVVHRGGLETVNALGTAVGTVLSSGALAFISSAGTFSGGTLVSGASLFVAGSISGGLVMSGGRVTLASGAHVAGGQALTMAGSGNWLEVAANTPVNARIAEFSVGDKIDLLGPGFRSGFFGSVLSYSQRTDYGVLTVKGGTFGLGTSQTLLIGGYHTANNFVMGPDGRDGTLLTYKL